MVGISTRIRRDRSLVEHVIGRVKGQSDIFSHNSIGPESINP